MRERNGWIDDGSQVRGGSKKCPKCGSFNFTETISLEQCFDCDYTVDYWGGDSTNNNYTGPVED